MATTENVEISIDLITETSEGLMAFGHGYGFESDVAGLLVWESRDGLDWAPVGGITGVPAGLENARISLAPYGFVAHGVVFDGEHEGRTRFLHSTDGRAWSDVTPDIELLENEHLFLHEDIVVGEAGAITVGAIEFYPPEPPLEVEYAGLTIVVEYERNSLEILDADGVLVYEGSSDEVYGEDREGEDGITVFDPEGGKELFVMSWDVLAEIDEAFTDMDHGGEPDDVVVEIDAYTLRISGYEPGNPEGAEFEISETLTGAPVATGSLPELTQGPPPRFVADDGTVVLAFPSWEAWWEAESEAYEGFEEGFEEDHYSKPLALVSVDGLRWQQVDLGGEIASNQNAYLHDAFSGPDGFRIRGSVENRDVHRSTEVVWTSADGVTWDVAPVANPETEHPLWNVTRTSAGFLGVTGEGEDGAAGVLFSRNGVDWEPALVVTGEPGTYSWVQSLAAGDLGAAVVIVTEGPYEEYHGDEFHGDEMHGDDVEGVTTTVAAEAAPPTTEAPATTVVAHGDQGFDEGEVIQAAPPTTRLFVSFDGRTFFAIVDDGSFEGLWISTVHVVGERVFVVAQEDLAENGDVGDDHGSETFEVRPLVVLVGVPGG